MLYVYTSNIRTGSWADFEKWVTGNRERFAKAQPQGWALKGFYITAFGLGDAHVEIHWEIPDYAAFDAARSTAQEKGPYNKLLTEMHSFLDPATGRARLMKEVGARDSVIVGC